MMFILNDTGVTMCHPDEYGLIDAQATAREGHSVVTYDGKHVVEPTVRHPLAERPTEATRENWWGRFK